MVRVCRSGIKLDGSSTGGAIVADELLDAFEHIVELSARADGWDPLRPDDDLQDYDT